MINFHEASMWLLDVQRRLEQFIQSTKDPRRRKRFERELKEVKRVQKFCELMEMKRRMNLIERCERLMNASRRLKGGENSTIAKDSRPAVDVLLQPGEPACSESHPRREWVTHRTAASFPSRSTPESDVRERLQWNPNS